MAAGHPIVHRRRCKLEAAPMRIHALPRWCAALLVLPVLSGCVAAIAVPLMTAAGALTQKKRSRAEIVADLPAANAAALAALPEPAADRPASAAEITTLTALPPPSGGSSPGPWEAFGNYALARAKGLAEGRATDSVLLAPGAGLRFETRLRPCDTREAAVIVDLDPGSELFAPGSAGAAAPIAAATMAQIRAAGIVVLWVSQASANEVAGVAEALEASGLDPMGRDPILLVRNEEERKQVLREEANKTVCVVAIAGDRRSDFDELFDYLRDPSLARAYDGQIGDGWFLVPGLFE
jgi:hypothetical protein